MTAKKKAPTKKKRATSGNKAASLVKANARRAAAKKKYDEGPKTPFQRVYVEDQDYNMETRKWVPRQKKKLQDIVGRGSKETRVTSAKKTAGLARAKKKTAVKKKK